MSDLKRVAEEAVAAALAEGAEAAEAFIASTRSQSVHVERNRLANAETSEEFGIALRAVKAKRLGFAYLTDPGEARLAASRALAAARALPETDFSFAPKKKLPSVAKTHDKRVADWTIDEAAQAILAGVERARSLAPALVLVGGLGWEEERLAIANSEGLVAEFKGTRASASLSGVLRDGATSTGFDVALSRRLDLDLPAMGERVARMALDSRFPKAFPSGETTVLFAPTAFAEMFSSLFLKGVTGEAGRSGQSVYATKRGKSVLPEAYGVVDDGTAPGGILSAPFDDEGVASERSVVVAKGVLKAPLDDLAGAAKSGGKATASALRADRLSTSRTFRAPPSAHGRNVLLTGKAKAPEALVAEVKRGILVHDVMGVHTANAASGDFNVNSSVVFAIEKGEITGAAEPVLLSGNFPKLLAKMAAVGSDAKALSGGFSPAIVNVPTVRLDGVRVSG